ncbi:MAG: hypothetical protein NVSMB52_10150 [Chloroflexota bacterium]
MYSVYQSSYKLCKELKLSDKVALEEWEKERDRLNSVVLMEENLGIKRFFALDHQAYVSGSLASDTKELLGLVASLVLRCDDCVTYHLIRCHDEGINHSAIVEGLNVGLVVGGSIVIPHLRRAMERLHEIEDRSRNDSRDELDSNVTPHQL